MINMILTIVNVIIVNVICVIAFIFFIYCEFKNTKARNEQSKELKIQNKLNTCRHKLRELNYFYDDDWYVRGSIAWDNNWNEKTFHYCVKCGQVFVKNRKKNLKKVK